MLESWIQLELEVPDSGVREQVIPCNFKLLHLEKGISPQHNYNHLRYIANVPNHYLHAK